MALKLLQISAPVACEATLIRLSREHEAVDFHRAALLEDDHALYHILSRGNRRQALIDDLYGVIKTSPEARINILAVEASIPDARATAGADTREELMMKLRAGIKRDHTFILLVLLSTIVALIGLLQDNVAVVVGAMVIAPLLGPNLGFAFGSAIGDRWMMARGFETALTGIVLALFMSACVGYLWGGVPQSEELMSRTVVGLDSVLLAAASGIAGVVSLTTGLSMTLVGVMVAVALMPPTVTLGFMIGAGAFDLAMGAGLLLAVNVVCVNLAGLGVFLVQGFGPLEAFRQKIVRRWVWLGLGLWSLLLGLALWAVAARQALI